MKRHSIILNINTFTFSDGSTAVLDFSDKDIDILDVYVYILGKTKPNDCLMAILGLIQTLQTHEPTNQVNFVFSYTPYARGDKPFNITVNTVERTCVYSQLELFFKTIFLAWKNQSKIKSIGFRFDDIHSTTAIDDILKRYSMGCSKHIHRYTKLVNGLNVLEETIKSRSFDLVFPDSGSMERCNYFFNIASKDNYTIGKCVLLDKVRHSDQTVEIVHKETLVTVPIEIDCKTALIVDDIIDGGRTIIESAKILKGMGYQYVAVLASHLILSQGLHDIGLYVDYIIPTSPVSDYVKLSDIHRFNQFK